MTPKIVPIETPPPQNSVEIVQTAEQVNEPIVLIDSIVQPENTIEIETVETTVTTTEVSNASEADEIVQTTETHEIKTEITSETESVSNVETHIDNTKLSEPENNEMTGEIDNKRFCSESTY